MKVKSRLLFSFASYAMLSACSKTDSSESVSGEVFIRTRGGETIPLSLVEVRFIDAQLAFDAIQTAYIEHGAKTSQDYFDALPSPVITAKTDSQGRFVVSLPKKKLCVAAHTERQVGSKSENLYWIISFSDQEKITLANDNLIGTTNNTNMIPSFYIADSQQ